MAVRCARVVVASGPQPRLALCQPAFTRRSESCATAPRLLRPEGVRGLSPLLARGGGGGGGGGRGGCARVKKGKMAKLNPKTRAESGVVVNRLRFKNNFRLFNFEIHHPVRSIKKEGFAG